MLKTLLGAIPTTIWWCLTFLILAIVVLHSRGCLQPRGRLIQPRDPPKIHHILREGEQV
jgi:hypothetical protein